MVLPTSWSPFAKNSKVRMNKNLNSHDKSKATSTSHRKRLQRERDALKKKQAVQFMFEEKLKNAADQTISLDLDDGVKVKYAKFGDLLAESKAICGTKEDD